MNKCQKRVIGQIKNAQPNEPEADNRKKAKAIKIKPIILVKQKINEYAYKNEIAPSI